MTSRGREFFQNPGPTNIPQRILHAMHRPSMDYRGKAFIPILDECLDGLSRILKTKQSVVVTAGSGHGAWEAALVNVFSPDDKVLSVQAGYFAEGWGQYAEKFGLDVETLSGDWQSGVSPDLLEERLRKDVEGSIKGILLTHCETSTSVMTDVAAMRAAIDRAGHDALLLVDVISSLGCTDFRMDEWGVDVAAGGSQKGLMLPTGLCFTGISRKALERTKQAKLPRAYWNWDKVLKDGVQASFPGTGPVHMLYGLQESVRMIHEEGLENVFARHERFAAATRKAVEKWAERGSISSYAAKDVSSPALTTIFIDGEPRADEVRSTALNSFGVQLASGLDRLRGKAFRIAHMGDLNEPMLLGALACTEMAIRKCGIDCGDGGIEAAMQSLSG